MYEDRSYPESNINLVKKLLAEHIFYASVASC